MSEKMNRLVYCIVTLGVLWPIEILTAAWVTSTFIWWGMEFRMVLLAFLILTVIRIYFHTWTNKEVDEDVNDTPMKLKWLRTLKRTIYRMAGLGLCWPLGHGLLWMIR